jgi:Protein of unknown function (DUF4232)
MNMKKNHAVAGIFLAAALAAAGGCTGVRGRPDASPSDSTASGTTAGTTTSGAAATGAATAAPPGTPPDDGSGSERCRLDQLAISIGGGDGAAGRYGIVLVFTRTGAASCYLQGYPGVAGLDAAGNQVAQARRAPTGQPARVDMPPRATASALLSGSNVPSDGGPDCPVYEGLLVTPPDETRSARLTIRANGCDGLEIHPVVSGANGR